MELAIYIAMIILSIVLMGMVVIQARTPGMARDSGSISRTRRGLEKTMHQATIVIAIVFLSLALVASLPIFGSGSVVPPA